MLLKYLGEMIHWPSGSEQLRLVSLTRRGSNQRDASYYMLQSASIQRLEYDPDIGKEQKKTSMSAYDQASSQAVLMLRGEEGVPRRRASTCHLSFLNH